MNEADDPGPIEVPGDALVLLVGAAGSGKTTLAGRLFPSDAILSSDALRGQLTGDESDQAASPRAFRILHAQADRRLSAGKLTVIDATNVSAYARRPLLERAASHGRAVIALVLDLPADACLERNGARTGRSVPESAVLRQLAALRRTLDRGRLAAEGVDRVVPMTTTEAIARASLRLTASAGRATLSAPPVACRRRRRNP